jgi:hypothetical protein
LQYGSFEKIKKIGHVFRKRERRQVILESVRGLTHSSQMQVILLKLSLCCGFSNQPGHLSEMDTSSSPLQRVVSAV